MQVCLKQQFLMKGKKKIRKLQIRRAFQEKIEGFVSKGLTKNKFLSELKILPEILIKNRLIDAGECSEKYDLGVCYLYEVLRLFKKLLKKQLDLLPPGVLSKLATNQVDNIDSTVNRVKEICLINQIDHLASEKYFTITQHRFLVELLVKLKPQLYKLETILYQNQNLTQIQRKYYEMPQQQYQEIIRHKYLAIQPQEQSKILATSQNKILEKEIQKGYKVQIKKVEKPRSEESQDEQQFLKRQRERICLSSRYQKFQRKIQKQPKE